MGTLASAIATLENTNPAYNNPGAISGTGDTGTSFGDDIGIYSSLEAGENALDNQLSAIYNGTSSYYTPDMTLSQFGEVYAPNQNYGSKIASILGVSPSTPLNQIPSGVSTAPPTFQNGNLVAGGKVVTPQGATTTYLKGNPTPSTGYIAQIEAWITSHTEDAVVVIVGLILVSAGVFAFKNTQTVIQVATKAAKRVAEVSS